MGYNLYERGSFTPTITFGGGSTGITYLTQNGYYIKIGEIVFVRIAVVLTNKGSSTGTARIASLPFTVTADASFIQAASNFRNITYPASHNYIIGIFDSSATTCTLSSVGNNTTNVAITDTEFANNSDIEMTGFYWTD